MILAEQFVQPALERGYSFWSGVPCSFLTPFINYVIQSPELEYIGAASEGEALAIAAGAHLAGRKTVVICQNSGLGNAVNPLTSMNYPFRIPTIFITTHRGAPGLEDEPQHELMGQITGDLLTTMRIPWEPFPADPDAIAPALDRAEAAMSESGRPYAFVMAKGTVEAYPLRDRPVSIAPVPVTPMGTFTRPPDERMPRMEAIGIVREALGGDVALLGTTGKIGRELYTFGHRPNQLYVVGSMGCASGMALGVHLGADGRRPVAVLDGDGAALMKMGTLATIGTAAPRRFIHVIIDNEAHESTGGQATVSGGIDFGTIAAGCGYRNVWRVDTPQALQVAVAEARDRDGPNMVHVKVAISSAPDLGRPGLAPVEVKEQFMTWFAR
ncbi:MAG TPA: phosphonopyruvate decarboxylase [Candidatus Limnocylindria bacterium]